VTAPHHVLILRTCAADMTAHGGFTWPESGPVEAPDWNPEPECGGGLHGFLWGEGDGNLADWSESVKWLIVRVLAADVVAIDACKVKFPRGEVVFVGDRLAATNYLIAHGAAGRAVIGAIVAAGDDGTATVGDHGTATAGNRGTATAGYRGTATAGYDGTATVGYRGIATAGYDGTATVGDGGTATAGYRGTATADDGGTATAGDGGTATAGDRGTATAGDRGTATAGDRGTATAGDGGTATAGDDGTATAGDRGTATAGDDGTATAGDDGTAAAGNRGIIRVRWWDGSRYRDAIGYVGEDGIEAGVAYHVQSGRLVRAVRS